MRIKGWVYIISNPAMPGLIKIGYSLKDPVLRAEELNNTGAPLPYKVEYELLVFDPRDVEQRVHNRISGLCEGKEWFRCSVHYAVSVIRDCGGSSILYEPKAIHSILQSNKTSVYKQEPYKTGTQNTSICRTEIYDPVVSKFLAFMKTRKLCPKCGKRTIFHENMNSICESCKFKE